MSFKDLNLGSTYNSSRNNLIEDFYIPVLSEAKSYDRVTGYFDSASLVLAAPGLKEFISNHGKMRLLCGTNLKDMDVEAVVNASEIAEYVSDSFLEDLDSISGDELYQNNIKLLAWMVDNDCLEIKIGIVKDENGYHGGILHEKTGILSDENENVLLFSGSNNETRAGWQSKGLGNIEKFKVFNSWEDSKFITEDIESFEQDWNNSNKYLEVIDIPSAAKEGLIKRAPDSIGEVMELIVYESEKYKKKKDSRELRKYQKEAISQWVKNGYNGIFKMATGTGKTFTALNCINELYDNEQIVIIIACPYAHLVEQWDDDIKNFFNLEPYNIYGSANNLWKQDLSELSFKLSLGIKNKAIILTTHKTLSSKFFMDEISNVNSDFLLIVDEMHHISSESYSKGLLEIYKYRLGLSATPEIYNDDDKTNLLFDYFGGIVFTLDLDDAINSFDEDGKTFLAQYNYFPKKIRLTNEELKDYFELSDKISKLYHINKKNQSNAYKRLLMNRKNIINNAKNKYQCLIDILNSYENLDHLIIFCSPQQLNNVLTILKEHGIKAHKFTEKEKTRKSKEFGGLSQRQYLVNKFDEGYYKSLVAIKCLDEGVDIPSADKVIIMSSSNNPREYVQRRGRVLRRNEGKDSADIYDLAVIEYDSFDNPIDSIVGQEKIRLMDFFYSSNNKSYCFDLFKKWGIL